MNSDQIKGAAKQVAGEAQRQYGKVTGTPSNVIKGDVKKVAGKVQQGFGNAAAESTKDVD